MIRILYPDAAGVMQTIALMDLEPTHEMESTPTDHPVESGSDITDHVRLELRPFSARCLITNSLYEAAESHMGAATPTTIAIPTGGGSFAVYGFTEAVDRVQLVYTALKELRASRTPCTIVTNLERYESMIIKRLSFPENATDAIELTIEAREIQIVTTTISANPRPRQVRGHPRTQAGTQSTTAAATTPAPPTTPPSRSGAAALADSIAGFLR